MQPEDYPHMKKQHSLQKLSALSLNEQLSV